MAQARTPNYAKWRAATLITVYALIALHIAHWRITGRSLAPLELHEVMMTTEQGIITAGFLFMCLAVLSALVFGRFFCSWACHLLAMQDLCDWLLKRVRIKPKPVRSRVLLFVAPAAVFYMFLWPHIERMAAGRPAPKLRIAGDAEGWASFYTTDFWRSLPGPAITILTFAVCGFAIIYLLGSRSFCRYLCPYGVVFGLMDRLTLGRIRLRKGFEKSECADCGICTSTCSSHIRVHEEIGKYGMVVNQQCLRDMDCVSVCPRNGIKYGIGQPSLLKMAVRTPYDFSLGEDLLMAAVFVGGFFAFRGLYDEVPFLMSLGIAAALSYFAILTLRMFKRKDVRLNNFQIKRRGRLTGVGTGFASFAFVLWAFVGHSAFIRYQAAAGDTEFEKARTEMHRGRANPETLSAALGHFETCAHYGLSTSLDLDRKLASLYGLSGKSAQAQERLERIVERDPNDAEAGLRLAAMLGSQGRMDEAAEILHRAAKAKPRLQTDEGAVAQMRSDAHEMLGEMHASRGNSPEALAEFETALREVPGNGQALLASGAILCQLKRYREAESKLRAALTSRVNPAPAHALLGLALMKQGKDDEALSESRAAINLDTNQAVAYNVIGMFFERRGNKQGAFAHYRRAAHLDPSLADARQSVERLSR